MASRFQAIVNTLKQVLPRRGSGDEHHDEIPTVPMTETEAKVVEQAVMTEKRRWQQIVELGVPAGMLVSGILLTALAQLIGLWGVLGFLLLSASPVVYWQQRIERQLREMTDEIKKNRQTRR